MFTRYYITYVQTEKSEDLSKLQMEACYLTKTLSMAPCSLGLNSVHFIF